MTERPRIAISGSAGVGKTTLAARLAACFEVPLIEEQMRPLIESGVDLHDLTLDERKALLLDHYETAVLAMQTAITTHGGFVSDRSPADFAAFWLLYGFGDDAETDAFFGRTATDSALIGLSIMLPWGAIPLIDDGVRLADRWRQLHYQTLVEGVSRRYFDAERRVDLPADVIELDDRIAWASEMVNGGVGSA